MARAFAILLSSLAILIAGCQLVGKLQSRAEDPVDDGCTLPADGDAQIRLANFLPQAGTLDVCLKPSGASRYTRPLLRGAGLSCGGLAFKDVTVPFGAASGTFDAKAIASDAHVCSAPSIAEATGLTLARGQVTTVFVAGGNGQAPAIFAHGEGEVSSQSGAKLRFVNALGSTPLLFGLTEDPRLPTLLATPLTSPVPFGGVPAAVANTGLGPIDALGYLDTKIYSLKYPMGAGKTAGGAALLVVEFSPPSGKFTLFAVGDPTQSLYPVRALLCDDGATGTLKIACTESDPPSLSIDVFSTAIIGAFGLYDTVRRDPVAQAIAARTSDVVCVPELAETTYRKQAIADAKASGQFPYAAVVETDETSKATDATDVNGVTPPMPSGPPCGDPQIKATAEKVYQCLTSSCGTPANDPDGVIANENISCASSSCSTKFAPLFAGTQAQKRCFGCILAGMISYAKLGAAEAACETDPLAGYAFEANSPTFILSKLPLANVEAFVLPSTTFRRTIVRAELQLDEGDSIDLYCAKLTPNLGSAAPYSGPYGPDWHDENRLQASKLVAWVKQRTTSGRRAIVMGEFDSSLEMKDGAGNVVIAASDSDGVPTSDTMQTLVTAFPHDSVPPGYVPTCSFCAPPANPYNTGTVPQGLWMSRAFLVNFSEGAPLSAAMTMKDFTVTLPAGAPEGAKGPLSTHWAYSVKVQRR